jgi:hypothetical protein
MVLGVLAQPGPQGSIRVIWCGRNRFVALGGAVLCGDAAGVSY